MQEDVRNTSTQSEGGVASSFPIVGRSFAAHLCQEASSAFVLRLAPFLIVSGFFVLITAQVYNLREYNFFAIWLVLGLGQFLLVRALSRQKVYWRSCAVAIWAVGSVIGWWFLLWAYSDCPPFVRQLLLGFLVAGFGFLPWPVRYNITLATAFLVTSLAAGSTTGYEALAAILSLMIILAAAATSADNQLALMSRISYGFLGRYCESSVAMVTTTIRLLAAQLACLVDAEKAVIAIGTDTAEVVSLESSTPSSVDSMCLASLCQRVADIGADQGVLSKKNLGEKISAACREWFGFLPSRLYFVSFVTIVNDREKKVIVFVPLSVGVALAGVDNTCRVFASLVSLVRVSMMSARNRFVSTDALASSEHAVARREDQLNHIIHLVNNAAQDVVAACDGLREQGGASTSLGWIETSIRCLSAGVSDVKLLNEMSRVGAMGRYETVQVPALIEELLIYARYQEARGWSSLEIPGFSETLSLSAPSREYLLASLRWMMRQAIVRDGGGGVCILSVAKKDSQVCFCIVGPAGLSDHSKWEAWSYELSHPASDKNLADTELRAVSNFARLAKGEFGVVLPDSEKGYGGGFFLSLPVVEKAVEKDNATDSGLLLFIDDNPQVLLLYKRVAEAMSLPYRCIASYEEGARLIQESVGSRSSPLAMVVTDIQIGVHSGVDLVRLVRSTSSKRIPVVVVSGVNDETLRDRVCRAGADLFLTKPVSRARLVSEIQHLLPPFSG